MSSLCDLAKAYLGADGQRQVASVTSPSVTDVCTLDAPIPAAMARADNDPLFRARLMLEYLRSLDAPSFVPTLDQRSAVLESHLQDRLQKGKGITPQQALLIAQNLSNSSYRGYKRMPSSRPYVTLPEDHGLHYDVQSEWYFLVGSGKVAGKATFSVEFMIYTYHPFSPEFLRERGLRLEDYTYYGVHLGCVYAPAGGVPVYFKAPVSPLIPGSSGLVAGNGSTKHGNPFFLQVGGCVFASEQGGDLFPMQVRAVSLDSKGDPFTVSMRLDKNKPLFLQGKEGCDPCIMGLGSLHYSYSSLAVTAGTMTAGPAGAAATLDISDKASPSSVWWFDHQWMSGMTGPKYPDSAIARAMMHIKPGKPFMGWSWFEWHIPSTNTEYTFSVVRYKAFDAIPTGEIKGDAGGSIILPNAKSVQINATAYLGGWILTDESGKALPVTPGAKLALGQIPWPTTWRFVIPEQVGVAKAVTYQLYVIMPYTVKRFAMPQSYKETPVLVTGSDGAKGRGFAESVGNEPARSNMDSVLSKLEIPPTEANIDLFTDDGSSTGLKVTIGIYVLCMVLIILVVLIGMVVGTKHVVKAHLAKKRAAPPRPPPPSEGKNSGDVFSGRSSAPPSGGVGLRRA